MKARAVMRRRRVPRAGGPRLTHRAALLALVLTALMLYAAVPLRTYLQQRHQMAELAHQAKVLEGQNSELEGTIRQLNDPAYLERIARECYGMARPGEISFIVVPRAGTARPPDCGGRRFAGP